MKPRSRLFRKYAVFFAALVPRRFLATVEDLVEAEAVGELSLKGFHRSITAYNIVRLRG